MTHDPLCPATKCDWGSLNSVCIGYENECGFVEHDCQCKLIAKVIKRERKKSKQRKESKP